MGSAIAHYQVCPAVNGSNEVAVTNPNQREESEDLQPLQHPRLAEFRSGDTQSRNSEHEWTRDSLDVLEKNHQTNGIGEDALTAANVMLPESIKASSRQSLANASENIDHRAETKYWEDIHKLQEHMPHLKNVGKQSRAHDQARFELFDYSKGNLVATETHILGSTASRAAKDFAAAILDVVPANTDTRLVIVDDLSSKLIDVLRTCLGISLEFFEEHLLNAGWHSDQYEDMGPATWNTTTDFVKDYVSVTWYRPIRARTIRPHGEQDPLVVLEPSRTPDKWEQKLSPKKHISHSTQPLVNILRLPWEAKLRSGGFSAWEERASVWSTQFGRCRIMVLLLDPMPLIGHTKVTEKTEQDPQGRRQVQSRQRERVLSSSEELEDQDPEDGRSRIKASTLGVSWFVQLFPKIFKFGTSGRMDDEATPSAELRRESGSHRSTQRFVRQDAQLADSYEKYCMFTGYSVRVPLMIYSDTTIPENKQRLSGEMRSVNSTTDTMKQLLQPYEVRVPDKQTRSTPLGSLFQIIVHDTLKILRLIDLTLTQMDLEMLDDVLVQLQIDDWRRVLHKFDIELRSMESSIPEFADFVLLTQRPVFHSGTGKGSRAIHELLNRFKNQVTQVQGRIESTHRSLMATLSLIESKRGISEAESVTKLTELAFFFIPLTFAASLFSMQVKELDGSTTSVGWFLAVALAITICSYALRLVIRSSKFLSPWRRWKDEIRAEKGIQPSAPIATSAVLKWIWQRLHTHIWPVYMMIPMAALLAALWTRPLREGMKIGITTALAMLCLATILLMISMRYGISEDWARKHRRRLAR